MAPTMPWPDFTNVYAPSPLSTFMYSSCEGVFHQQGQWATRWAGNYASALHSCTVLRGDVTRTIVSTLGPDKSLCNGHCADYRGGRTRQRDRILPP